MKNTLTHLIIAGLMGLAGIAINTTAANASDRTLNTVIADLASGGNIILMRHANSPTRQSSSIGMTEGCELQEGRGLDAEGFFQARFIGGFFNENSVPVSAGFTSNMCRTWDTARLVAGATPIMASDALKSTDVTLISNFKQILRATLQSNPRGNILLVTHSNIVPLFADWESETEIPSGVILIVDPETWTVKETLNLDIDLSVE